jgi:hypothetical protein
MAVLRENLTSRIQMEHPEAFDLCLCALPRWRHAASEKQRKVMANATYHTEMPHHLFMAPTLGEAPETDGGWANLSDPVMQEMEAVLKHTAHIPERSIRAAYIVTELRLDGYVLLKREANGRFSKVEEGTQ